MTHRFINADGLVSTGTGILGHNMFAYCDNNPVNASDSGGSWPKWVSGALNVVGGALQIAAGVALGATAGWTGFGAAVACFLIVNGAAQTAQGVGQIVNYFTNSRVMREDNSLRTSVQTIGNTVGGNTGGQVAGFVYDMAVSAANVYAGATITSTFDYKATINNSIGKMVNSKLFSHNNGYGFKIGKNIEILYQNPNAAGGRGGTFFSYKGPLGKFRIDWDPTYGLHCHPPGHK